MSLEPSAKASGAGNGDGRPPLDEAERKHLEDLQRRLAALEGKQATITLPGDISSFSSSWIARNAESVLVETFRRRFWTISIVGTCAVVLLGFIGVPLTAKGLIADQVAAVDGAVITSKAKLELLEEQRKDLQGKLRELEPLVAELEETRDSVEQQFANLAGQIQSVQTDLEASVKALREVEKLRAESASKDRIQKVLAEEDQRRKEFDGNQRVSVRVLYRSNRAEEAQEHFRQLIGAGYRSSTISTDFRELREPATPGTTEIRCNQNAEDVAKRVAKVIVQKEGQVRHSSRLGENECEIWMF